MTAEKTLFPGPSIRLVLTGSCQSGCNFCHLEGNRPSGYYGLHPDIAGWKEKKANIPLIQRLAYAANDEDVNFINTLSKILEIKKVHLTGGEPSLHPEIEKFISFFNKEGFHTAITSHGEYSSDKLKSLIRAGTNSVIFSLHCVTEEEYLSMDLVAQQIEEKFGLERSLIYAKSRLEMKRKNISLALERSRLDKNFEVSANIVIRESPPSIAVIRFCNEIGLKIRLQREMNKPWESDKIISDIITLLNAKKVSSDVSFDDSSRGGTDYEYNLKNGKNGFFRIKDFSPVYLNGMCNGCRLKNTPKCREKFYGIRVQRGYVRLCIDRHDEKVLYKFSEILNNKQGVLDDLKKQYNVV